MDLKAYVVDAFTEIPFRGNPAGVCIASERLPDKLMQSIAAELNHAETAFLAPVASNSFSLSWFTPIAEVELCGHATLAASHVLWETGLATGDIEFQTASGTLKAAETHGSIEMDFPAEFEKRHLQSSSIESALGTGVEYVGKNRLFWLAEVASESAVRNLAPDLNLVSHLGLGGVVVTARSDTPADDFVSRVFAPSLGIPEDPVTGSAHCLLATYWSPKLGKTEMTGYQASARGGFVRVELLGARVLLKGKAITTLSGTLHV
jgi:PhzF family phenazine biosynthesis protein